MALDENRVYDQNSMHQVLAEPVEVARRAGVSLHCGEFGVIAKLPTDLARAWMMDLLSGYLELKIGVSFWICTRGKDNFYILDLDESEKVDCIYTAGFNEVKRRLGFRPGVDGPLL